MNDFWQVGFVVEVSEDRRAEVMDAYRSAGLDVVDIGKVTDDGQVQSSKQQQQQ